MTKKHITTLGFTALAFACLSVPANAKVLSDDQIVQLIAGKTVYLSTKMGFEFPLTYAQNGRVTGDGTGTGLGKYFAPKESGKWWVAGDQMCQKFPTWYKGNTLCFSLISTGKDKLKWIREDGLSGSARISVN